MKNRIGRTLALSSVSAALAVGGLGAASAGTERNHPEDGPHAGAHHHCKGLKGKKKNNCEKHHHGAHHSAGLY